MISTYWILIGVTALISYNGFQDESFFSKYKFQVKGILNGEKIRLITSGFLHADLGHLAFNMLTLYFFAPIVISYFGTVVFLFMYFASLIVGNYITLQLNKNNPYYSAIGASGAVSGILYSAIMIYPDMTLGIFFIIPMPAYLFGILYLLYTLYAMRAKQDNIGHSAHFGGAATGFLLTILLSPVLISGNLLLIAGLMLPLVLFVAMYVRKK